MIEEAAVIVSAPDLASADLNGEMVVLNLKSGHYYGLNEVGARILELVQTPRSLASVIDDLSAEYDVQRGQLRDDVLSFVGQMVERQIIEVNEVLA